MTYYIHFGCAALIGWSESAHLPCRSDPHKLKYRCDVQGPTGQSQKPQYGRVNNLKNVIAFIHVGC